MADPLVCYLVSHGYVSSTNQYFPCGSSVITGASAQACCNAEDYCMDDGICHYTRGGVTNGTGYYMAGCTDPTWKDPACPKQCTSEFRPDIIYDRASSEWRCCSSTEDTLDCQQNPSKFVVKAPDPQELSTILQLSTPAPSSAATTSITSITSISSSPTSTLAKTTATNSPTGSPPSRDQDASSGLSTGATAGVAIAIITLVVLLIGVYLFFRIRGGAKPTNETKKHKSEESRNISLPPKPSGAFKALSSQPNSALPSPKLQSPNMEYDSRRDSEFPISLQEPAVAGTKGRFSYEYDIGPYEMETSMARERVPYERPMSAQELEGTKVQVQEMDASPADQGPADKDR